MKLTGSVMRNGRALVRGIPINLRGHGTRWSGELHLPKGATIYPGSYDLHLSDGRAGRMMIANIDGKTAFFDGDGELKKN
jgi:hypothetical protein